MARRPAPRGQVTRGTTHPNRLRRVDRWTLHTFAPLVRSAGDPLLVDLGFGADAVTTVEWADRAREVRKDVEVVGIEIDPERVESARPHERERLSFRHGGFEIPLDGRDALMVRAFNVLRQYDEAQVQDAWDTVMGRLQPGGVFIEGTCDEIGRIATWVTMRRPTIPVQRGTTTRAVPETLTFACNPAALEQPSQFAERLPKALIHRNIPGEPIHAFLENWDQAWRTAAPHQVFGARQRWVAAIRILHGHHPEIAIVGGMSRWRLGELTITWASLT